MATTKIEDRLRVSCALSLCDRKREVTRVQDSVGGYWLCPEHRSRRDVDVGQGWGFVNELEVA